jgi:hypothetical protein
MLHSDNMKTHQRGFLIDPFLQQLLPTDRKIPPFQSHYWWILITALLFPVWRDFQGNENEIPIT